MPARQTELTNKTFAKALQEVKSGVASTRKKTPLTDAKKREKCEALLRYAALTPEEGGLQKPHCKGQNEE